MVYTLDIVTTNIEQQPTEVIMATAAGARVSQLESRAVFSAAKHGSTCTRCGGLMVSDFCMDLLNSTGELEFAAKRCVQCGAVVDPVILHNRQLRQESMSSRSVRRSIQSMECEVGS
jgi:hypothetical protein